MALTDNLVSYYKLDDTADSVGSNTLTNTNSVTFNSGLIGNGADFGNPNTNKSLSVGTTFGITSSSSFTINGWFNFYDNTTADIAMTLQIATNSVAYQLMPSWVTSGKITIERNKIGVAEDRITAFNYSSSVWTMITLTYDGTTLTAYSNGTSQGTVSSTGNGSSGGFNKFIFGADINASTGNPQFFTNTKSDEMGIWTRVLSGAEITSLYNAGAGLQYPFNSSTATFSNFLMMGV